MEVEGTMTVGLNSKKLYIKSDAGITQKGSFIAHLILADPIATDADAILAATNLGAEAQEITAGITDPDYPRCLSAVGNVSGIAGNVVITGKNFAGEEITETLALNGVTPRDGAKAFKNVTQIDLPEQTHTPAKQVETITVAAACTQNGTLVFTVTADGMTHSPKAVNVDVTTDDDSATKVAVKVRAALAADVDVGGFFTVGGTDADVALTAKAYAADDGTMEIAMTDAPNTGVTVGSSTDTTGGVLGVAQIETITVETGASKAGTLVFRVTAAEMNDSPKDVNVEVTGDDDTANEVATKIRAALNLDDDVSGFFTIGGSDADIVITAKEKVADDATMAMALQDADGTSVTVGASADTETGVLPVLQKETITVTHQADAQGTLVVTVTAANMENSPKAVNVNVDEDDSTVTLVATKIKAALEADEDIGGFFTVSGSAGEINLTAKTDAADDGTMEIALSDAPTTGVTVGASANTKEGVPLDVITVGVNDILGLPYKLSHNTVIPGMTFLNNTREGTEPAVTVSATAIESNTIDLSSSLDGNQVDVYLAV
jgi:hypothetical protein